MKKLFVFVFISNVILFSSCKRAENNNPTDSEKVEDEVSVNFVHDSLSKSVSVYFGDKLFTSYLYTLDYYKPVLYPLITASGESLTRAFPIEVKENERVDHPHHVGYWLNYGDVNGIDFWNHSDAISAADKDKYGTIFPVSFEIDEYENTLGILTEWKASSGTTLIEEQTKFAFYEKDGHRFIDRTSVLIAKEDISLSDNKEGFLGIRVSRALEHPSTKPELFTDSNGVPSKVKVMNNDGVTGEYLSSEGVKGEDVWATRAKWVTLNGIQNGQNVSLTIYDHPENLGYPTYWHARGYGLFAANPLGQKVFSNGSQELNAKIVKGDSLTFRYRVMVSDKGVIDAETANQYNY